jgi:hypothetical protein
MPYGLKSEQRKTDDTLNVLQVGQELLKEEMLAKMEAHHERQMAKMDSRLEILEACPEKTEATKETESESEHQEVPKVKKSQRKLSKQWRTDMGAGTRETVVSGISWPPPAEGCGHTGPTVEQR